MVKLTDEEKRLLQGEEGEAKQICMQYIVEMAEIAGAEDLVDLDGTGDFTHPGLALSPYYHITLDQLKEADAKARNLRFLPSPTSPPSRSRLRSAAGRTATSAPIR
jgi:hypothetical protein